MLDFNKLYPKMLRDRQYLHKNAECGFDTPLTSRYIINTLKKIGYTPRVIGKGGIVAETKANMGSYTLLRADFDALPIFEETDLEFKSQNGNMHACGHDIHTAILLGVARMLKKQEETLKTPVRLFFQPAEEILGGAKDAIENGLLEEVNQAFMLHVLPHIGIKSGTVIIPNGGIGAPAALFYRITLQGVASHGASPSAGRGVVAPMAQIALAFDSIVSSMQSSNTLVHSLGKIECGNNANSVPDTATIEGTMRSPSEETLNTLLDKVKKATIGISSAYGVGCNLSIYASCPPLNNNDNLSNSASEIFNRNNIEFLSQQDFEQRESTVGGSEDFAYIAEKIPSLMIGIVAGTKPGVPLHNPKIEFDENIMPTGAKALYLLSQEIQPKK